MADNIFQILRNRIYMVHAWLIKAGETVNVEQFAHVFSQDAPPIGWHLWHMARFADRLQSKLADVTDGSPAAEIWYRDNVSSDWNLSPDNLGVFESGMGQAHKQAQATVSEVGQAAMVDYAKAVFEVCDATTGKVADDDFNKTYQGIRDYEYDAATGKVWATRPKESTVADDLIMHSNHGSRHLGMMEALRGFLGTAGTLSV